MSSSSQHSSSATTCRTPSPTPIPCVTTTHSQLAFHDVHFTQLHRKVSYVPFSHMASLAQMEHLSAGIHHTGSKRCKLFVGQLPRNMSAPLLLALIRYRLAETYEPLAVSVIQSNDPNACSILHLLSHTPEYAIQLIHALHHRVLFDHCGAWIACNDEELRELSSYLEESPNRSTDPKWSGLPKHLLVLEKAVSGRNRKKRTNQDAPSTATRAGFLSHESQLGVDPNAKLYARMEKDICSRAKPKHDISSDEHSCSSSSVCSAWMRFLPKALVADSDF